MGTAISHELKCSTMLREGTHGKSIKVGPPPNTQAFSNLPIAMSRLDISPLAIVDTKTFIESGQEAILVGLAWVEVSSGATIRSYQGDERCAYSL
jgi:hypothetical protein